MSKLHGFRRGEEIIHITHLPNHKKPVLLVGNGNCAQKIATFDSEEYAEGFCDMLSKWLGAVDMSLFENANKIVVPKIEYKQGAYKDKC